MFEGNIDNKAARGSIAQIILRALSSGDKYGYEICKDIEKITNGKLILKQPSLYSSLRRMEEQGVISSYWEESDLGGRRHYYSLTDDGKKALENSKFLPEEELINKLPNKNPTTNVNAQEDEVLEKPSLNDNTTSVVKQENLFDLSKNTNQTETKFEDKSKNENDNTFLQFDLFNENVSFVKEESSKPKENISAYVNKYSDLDNHTEEIEPETETNNETTENLLTENKISYSDSPTLQDENKEDINKSSNLNSNAEQLTTAKLPPENEQLETIKRNTNIEQISWILDTNEEENVSNNDYKSLIGQLYNNSRLDDPYEENKYQTFKEIFPSTNYKEKQKEESDSNSFTLEGNKTDEKITNMVKSSEESNIDCEDIRNLNNLYNLQGIEIKIHDKKENKKSNKIYTDKNKLNMVSAWIVSAIILLEVLFSYLILKSSRMIVGKQRIVFYLALAFTFSYLIISTFENLLDRYKLIIIEENFKRNFMVHLFIFILAIIAIFTINIILGMTSLFQTDFFVSWFLPFLLSTNILISTIVYHLLLKSRYFNT